MSAHDNAVTSVNNHVNNNSSDINATNPNNADADNITATASFDVNSKEVNQTLIYSGCEEGQEYRKSLLKGRWICFIAGGMELVKCAHYEHFVYGLGCKAFMVEEENNPVAKKLEADGVVIHIKVDLKSRPTLVSEVVEAIQKSVLAEYAKTGITPPQLGNHTTGASEGLLSACFTLWDDAVCLASRVQHQLGMKGDKPSVIDCCHDKFNARRALENAGIKGPKNVLIGDAENCKKLAHELRYPIILKPLNGAASIGLHKFESPEALIEAFPKCQAQMVEIYEHEELMGLTFEDSTTSSVKQSCDLNKFCAEEFIGGTEYDVDIIVSFGKVIYGGINQDWSFRSGWMCERGMHHPASLDKAKYKELVDAAGRNALALGCTTGVFHVEMKWDPDMGPQLIECNPRMGGAGVWQLHRNSWNCDLLLEACLCFAGIPSNPVIPEDSNGTNISLLLYCDKTGVLREDLDEYNAHLRSSLKYLDFLQVPMRKGAKVHGWMDSIYPSHLGRMDFFIPKEVMSTREAIEFGLQQRSHIVVPLESGDWRDPNDDCL